MIIQSFVTFSALVLFQWPPDNCPLTVTSCPGPPHCPIGKWAPNAPNPSEYFPPRLSSTVTCKIVVLVLKTRHGHHIPHTFIAWLVSRCPMPQQPVHSCPTALAFMHPRWVFLLGWQPWTCSAHVTSKTYMPCKWCLPHLLQWTGALKRRIHFQVGPSLSTLSYSKEFCFCIKTLLLWLGIFTANTSYPNYCVLSVSRLDPGWYTLFSLQTL